MQTIKEVADALGVSKTAIRNYMDAEFRAKHTEKNDKGVITITPEGCKLLSENIGKQPENTGKQFSETALITIPRSVMTLLEEQIREKDEQLRQKDKQIIKVVSGVRRCGKSTLFAIFQEYLLS